MAVVMVAMLAFGGTYAYFTATTTAKTGTSKTGTVILEKNVMATLVADGVVPGMTLINDSSKVQVNNTGTDVDSYVFVTFEVSFETTDGQTVSGATVKTGVTDETAATAEYANNEYYLAVTKAAGWDLVNGETNVYSKEVTASEAGVLDVCTQITFYGASQSTQKDDAAAVAGTLMGKIIKVSVYAQSIQAEGFADAEAAWAELKD